MNIVYQGKTYTVGQHHTPLELLESGLTPAQAPPGWREVRHPLISERAYGRAFVRDSLDLRVMITASIEGDQRRWLHISVSHRSHRLPVWKEMCAVKEAFCGPDRIAYQVHPPRAQYVNMAPVLHLWCPLDGPVTPDFTAGGETL